jgi:transcription termination/antitermination protein NusG
LPESDTSIETSPAKQLSPAKLGWHALWTRSHCEKLVRDQLAAKGFEPFLPTISIWSLRAGRQHQIGAPMFPGYIFLPASLDKHAYIEVRKSRGLVGLLGQGWDRLSVIPHSEMTSIERLQAPEVRAAPHPFLREGRRVRVVRGPLSGVEGFLVELRPNKGRLVVSVELLQRSVYAEIDCSAVAAA